MNDYETLTSILAIGTLLTGVGTIALAIITNKNNKNIAERQRLTDEKIADRQRLTDINIAKRQGVIDLHNSWNNIRRINPKDIIGPDVVNAINALSLTASLWNNDVMEHNLIYQSYWSNFKNLCDTLESLDVLVPGQTFTCKSLLTPDIRSVYRDMQQLEIKAVVKTNI